MCYTISLLGKSYGYVNSSCIAIMKLLNQTIAVDTSYLIYSTYAVSKTIASPYAQRFTVSMNSNLIVCLIVKCIVFHFEC